MDKLRFQTKTPILKGWSGDKKYCVTDELGQKYFLRISPMERYEQRKNLQELLLQVDKLGIPMCRPLGFGACEEGVYRLESWINGEDAEEVIPTLSEPEQYRYGMEAGRILKRIHSIPAPEDIPLWEERFGRKMDRYVHMYHEGSVKFEGAEYILDYIRQNRDLIKGRPQCFQHGDYHIGNMMLSEGKLYIIDFDRNDFGDPWEEFNRIVWCAQASPEMARGMVDGYFAGNVPMEFWRLLALYISSNTLGSMVWAPRFGEEEIKTMTRQAEDVLSWYDNMKRVIPIWYQ